MTQHPRRISTEVEATEQAEPLLRQLAASLSRDDENAAKLRAKLERILDGAEIDIRAWIGLRS